MNEVKKCSISGVAFTLDVDAFAELEHYFATLRQAYQDSADGPEILDDIEARVAELILSVQDGSQVVEKPLILNIIRQLGSASDISDTEENPDADLHHDSPRIPRRLYRDMENAKLGGVCAGIGKYFDIDPIWIRLGLFLPLLVQIPFHPGWLERICSNFFGVFVLSYLIMWFAVPVARTARQKLEMNGTPITTQSVAEATAAAVDVDSKARSVVAETVSVFGKVILILLKILAGTIVLGLILSACALVIGLLCVAIGGYELLNITPAEFSIGLPITGILVALIMVLLLIYVLMCLIASRKPNSKIVLATFLLWIAAIVACVLFAVRAKRGTEAVQLLQNGSRTEMVRPDLEELQELLDALNNDLIEADAAE